ncbi:hypothetical protein GCM10023186_02930 [Hymenobacter koreensis]|uniref:Uncharacterized protein n=1 Tax=Hymenobacter koreensis TaxID=1084523 RepID=A0ABP8ITZ0_9BACT
MLDKHIGYRSGFEEPLLGTFGKEQRQQVVDQLHQGRAGQRGRCCPVGRCQARKKVSCHGWGRPQAPCSAIGSNV